MPALTEYLTSEEYPSIEEANVAYLFGGRPEDAFRKISLPKVKWPSLRWPDIRLDLKGPDISLKGPDIDLGKIDWGKYKLPSGEIDWNKIKIDFPELSGKIGLEGARLPAPTLPSLPKVELPTPTLPSIDWSKYQLPGGGIDWAKLKVDLPSVDLSKVGLPSGIDLSKIDWSKLGIGLPEGARFGLGQVRLPTPALGEWSEVAEKTAPAVKVGLGGVKFEPTPGQMVEIGKAVGGVLERSPVQPISAVGEAMKGVLTPVGQVVSTVGQIASQIAPWKLAYDIGSQLYEGFRKWLLPDRSEERKELARMGSYRAMQEHADAVNRSLAAYNELASKNPEYIRYAYQLAEGNKGLFGGTAMQNAMLKAFPELNKLSALQLDDLFKKLEVVINTPKKVPIRDEWALSDAEKGYWNELFEKSPHKGRMGVVGCGKRLLERTFVENAGNRKEYDEGGWV